MDNEQKPQIKLEDIKDDCVKKYERMFKDAQSIHNDRTRHHDFYAKVAHMQNLYDKNDVIFSEGSTQAIERKLRAQTIQRVPDGEIVTQYDKNSIEQAEIDFLFKNKILSSEFAGKDMYKNLWKTFDNAYIYGFGCVRTGFEKDRYGDIRISYKQIPYNMIYPSPDCDYIEEAEWYIHEEMISHAELKSLFNDNDELIDKTWEEKTIRYILQTKHRDGQDANHPQALQDYEKGVSKTHSIKVRTLYKRGANEFISYCPNLNAKLRTVKNYDPRKEVPIHFMILEPDPEFPLGVSSVMWTLSQQQFADAFQSTAYNELLLSLNPPLMGFGDLTETDIYLEPGAWWAMGTNPNNKIEKYTVETTTMTQYGSILEQVAGSMNRNLNVADQTVASDAHVPGWSKTPQGVEAQQTDKTITVNQYQKRVEIFFSEWSNHALRSYLAAMKGVQNVTVDEETRRKINDIEETMNKENPDARYMSIITDNKIAIDFNKLSADRVEFQVRTGSLIQSRQEEQRANIQELLVPVSQSIGALSDENRPAFEANMMQMIERLFELSDIDFAKQSGQRINDKLIIDALKAAYMQIVDQNKAIQQLQQLAISGLPQEQEQPQQQLPQPEQQQVPEQGSSQLPPEVMQQLMAQQQAQQQPAEAPAEGASTPLEQV